MKRLARGILNFPLTVKRSWARSARRRLSEATGSLPLDVRVGRRIYVLKRLTQRSIRRGFRMLKPGIREHWSRQFADHFWLKLHELSGSTRRPEDDLYVAYTRNQRLSRAELDAMRAAVEKANGPNAHVSDAVSPRLNAPLVSVLTPVFNADPKWLDRLAASISQQVYSRWEWVIVDDGSWNPATRAAVERLAEADDRVVVDRLETNRGVVAATNRAAELASGELLAFVDHDDELFPDSLWHVVQAFESEAATGEDLGVRPVDVVYTDEEMAPVDRPPYPHFKTAFAPESLTAVNFLCHLLVVRRSAFEDLGGLAPGTDGVQDFDLVLRLFRAGCRFAHLPRVLYRWRLVPRSLSRRENSRRGWVRQAESIGAGACRALQRHYDAIGLAARPEPRGDWVFPRIGAGDMGKVTIVICSRDGRRLLERCVRSIESKTTYPNYDLLIVDNGSRDPSTLEYLRRLSDSARCRVIRIESGPEGFNFARLNNLAAQSADGEHLVFLNDDTEVVEPDWLGGLVGWLQVAGVGAVGAKLLFPDRRLQHAGVICGAMDWGPWHVLYGLQGDTIAFHGHAQLPRNCLAATGACLATRRSVFLEMGGFDERRFAVCFNDVDYCLRLAKAGLRTVYSPQAALIHHESSTRPAVTHPHEALALKQECDGIDDPYWNPNYSRESYCFEIRTRRRARRVVPVRPRILALAPEVADASVVEIEELLRAAARMHSLSYSVERISMVDGSKERHWRFAELAESAAMEGITTVVADGASLLDALPSFSSVGIPCIARIGGRLAFPDRSDSRELARRLEGLDTAYQVAFDCRHHRLEAERGRPRGNYCVIESIPLDDPHLDGPARMDWRRQYRRQRGLEESVFLSAVWKEGPHAEVGAAGALQVVAGLDEGKLVEVISGRDELDAALAACDCMVAAPRVHSRAWPLLRAMQWSLPLIGSRPVVDADLLVPGQTGLEIREGDARGRREAMRRLMEDPGLARRLGEQSRVWLQTRRSPERVIGDWAELFMEAAELCLSANEARRLPSADVSGKMFANNLTLGGCRS